MRILITGATGFVGGHLAEALLAEGGHAVAGLSRAGRWPADLGHLAGRVDLHALDLHDRAGLEDCVRSGRPDCIFHLAGYAHAGKSFADPDRCWADNLDGTRALFAAVHRSGLKPRIVFASTGLVYGDPDEPGRPCDERTPLKPASPYAASKAAADLLGYQVTRNPGLDVVRVRMFNQIGPRQSADYAVANFARQIAAIEAGTLPPVIDTGDLSAERDVTDVRDLVRALRLIADAAPAGAVFNAGRGETVRVRDLLDGLVKLARVPVDLRSKPDPTRAGDTAVVRADSSALRAATGWDPRFALADTLADTLAYWRGVAGRA